MKQQKSVNSMIVFEIRSLVSKINEFLPETSEVVMANGLLVTAAHLLTIQNTIPDYVATVDSDDEEEESPSRRRNLRQEWSGPLPRQPESKRKRKPLPVVDSVNGISGGDPDDFETIYDASSNAVCAACNGPIDSHAKDKHLPILEDGRVAYIVCDRTRVYGEDNGMK